MKNLTLSILLLSGCGTYLDEPQIQAILEQCSKNDGLKYVSLNDEEDNRYMKVKCNDGAVFKLKRKPVKTD